MAIQCTYWAVFTHRWLLFVSLENGIWSFHHSTGLEVSWEYPSVSTNALNSQIWMFDKNGKRVKKKNLAASINWVKWNIIKSAEQAEWSLSPDLFRRSNLQPSNRLQFFLLVYKYLYFVQSQPWITVERTVHLNGKVDRWMDALGYWNRWGTSGVKMFV